MTQNSTAHPKGLYVLFTTEMWERFNFYGMRAILSLFLVSALAFKQNEASILYGGFLGLSYLTPMFGGTFRIAIGVIEIASFLVVL